MDLKYIANILSRFFLIILTLIIVGNVMYHVVNDGTRQLEAVATVEGSIEKTVNSVATVVRSEHALAKDKEGICSFTVSEGQRIAKNAKLADVYEDTGKNRELISRIDKLEEELYVLQSAVNLESAYTVSSIEKKINEASLELSKASEAGDKKLCDALALDIRIYCGIRELKNGRTDYKDGISEIKEQISEAYAELGKPASSIKSDKAGFFYSDCDGYEEFFGELDLLSATLDELTEVKNLEMSANEKEHVGKIVTDYTWRILVPLTSDESMNFSDGKKYDVLFGDGTSLSMSAERVIRRTGVEDAFLVLSYDRIPGDFSFTRYQSVSVCYEKFEGFKVPLSSVRYLEGYEGVYILHGNVVDFRRIKILAIDDAFAVCDADFATSDGKYKSLKYYDRIVVKGEELYVGKIVN